MQFKSMLFKGYCITNRISFFALQSYNTDYYFKQNIMNLNELGPGSFI